MNKKSFSWICFSFGVFCLLAVSPGILAQPVLFSENGHYYELALVDRPVRWEEARDLASQRSFKGLQGHLATITSAAENEVVCNVGAARYWLGGFQDVTATSVDEGWQWVTAGRGPSEREENGTCTC